MHMQEVLVMKLDISEDLHINFLTYIKGTVVPVPN
jgi:hypothetical protein